MMYKGLLFEGSLFKEFVRGLSRTCGGTPPAYAVVVWVAG